MENNEKLNNLRHSAAHLLAAAVMEYYPDTKRTIGPATENGFYFDFDFKEPISDKELMKIEQKMRELSKKWPGFEGREVTKEEALGIYKDNEYKKELIEEIAEKGEKITFYKSGDYQDLCKVGHVENPKEELKHFKLLSIAGAYWRGDEKNKMLTRIYGTAWETKEDLQKYLWQLEEAKKRDHRKLGQELELFFIDEMVGKGLVMWLPKGTIIRDEIEKLTKTKEKASGYQRVVTPHIAKEELFLTSGHLPYYKDSMYPPMKMDDGTYYLKAMNCPHHHRVYQSKPRSYKDLPVRLAEYGTCYRNELSGTLAGLLRVRGMTMNDAHIYCRKDQIKEEFSAVMKLTMDYFEKFGLKDYWFRLSKWDPNHTDKYFNQPENWEYSEQVLRDVLNELGVKYIEVENEAAFYGPKVDVQFKSVIGREETMSTIQLDFVASKNFGLKYTDNEGHENTDIFVIHRAPLSVHERFLAFLIEHYGGVFPTWLSPVQVSIMPVADRHNEAAHNVAEMLNKLDIRAELNLDNKTLGAKIREATLQKVPYMIIIGDKELEKSTEDTVFVSARMRDGQDLGSLEVSQLINQIKEKIENYQ